MSPPSTVISLRTSPATAAQLDLLSELEGRSRADEARLVLETGLRERRLQVALERYRAGEVTLGRAAQIAGVTLYELAEALEAEGIAYNLDLEAVLEAVSATASTTAPVAASAASAAPAPQAASEG